MEAKTRAVLEQLLEEVFWTPDRFGGPGTSYPERPDGPTQAGWSNEQRRAFWRKYWRTPGINRVRWLEMVRGLADDPKYDAKFDELEELYAKGHQNGLMEWRRDFLTELLRDG